MRLTFAVFVLVVSVGGAHAQPFVQAMRHGVDPSQPDSFTFVDGERKCRVTAAGAALCQRDGSREWPFRLPVDDGRIEALSFFRDGDDLLMAYELSDGESGWAQIARVTRGAKRPTWRFHLPSLNMATPVFHEQTIVVAALAYLARINAETGSPEWRIERAYIGGGFEIPELELSGGDVLVHWRDGSSGKIRSECFDVVTGECRSCGS